MCGDVVVGDEGVRVGADCRSLQLLRRGIGLCGRSFLLVVFMVVPRTS